MRFEKYEDRKNAYLRNTPAELHTGTIMENLEANNFFTHPSSTKFHGAYEGGGFDHAFNVASLLWQWTEAGIIKWRKQRSPYLIGFWHDLCKLDAYEQVFPSDYDPNDPKDQ